MSLRILIIEDEINIAQSLAIALEAEGLTATTCEFGRKGLELIANHDLLILDLMLPDIDGLEVLDAIREKDSKFPIIIVSAKSDEDDLVLGLMKGADDYLPKPFNIRELILKIKRALARLDISSTPTHNTENSFLICKNVQIFPSKLIAKTISTEIKITQLELRILKFFKENAGRIISRSELLEKTWGHNAEVETRTVDNFIVRFRKNFETNQKKPEHFITKRSAGYLYLD